MGTSDLVPLTDEQGRLAADPASLRLAGRIAARFGRAYPPLADEFAGESYLALCKAAASYDPARGVTFRIHATTRIVGAMKDLCRRWDPRGYRRSGSAPPVVLSLDATAPGGGSYSAALADPDRLPVGWEEDSVDEVRGMARRAGGALIVLRYAHAATATLERAGSRLGVCRARAQQVHSDAVARLAERFKDGDMTMRGDFGGRGHR